MRYGYKIPENLKLDNPNNTSVVVVSCNKYKEVWDPFFILFNKYWPDCPYKVYFLTDLQGKKPNYNNVEVLTTSEDNGWCQNTSILLDNINTKRILLFQEDFLIKKLVNTIQVRQLINFSIENNVACLRFCPTPGPSTNFNSFVGNINKNDNYRFSMQLSLWDTKVIKPIIKSQTNIQDLEHNGIELTKNINQPFFSLYRESEGYPGGPLQYFITAVTNGIWESKALQLLKKNNIPIDNLTIGKKI